MRPSSLGGGRILRRTLSVRPVIVAIGNVFSTTASVTSRHLANYNDTHVFFGTHRGPHIVRPSRPHKLVRSPSNNRQSTYILTVHFYEAVNHQNIFHKDWQSYTNNANCIQIPNLFETNITDTNTLWSRKCGSMLHTIILSNLNQLVYTLSF